MSRSDSSNSGSAGDGITHKLPGMISEEEEKKDVAASRPSRVRAAGAGVPNRGEPVVIRNQRLTRQDRVVGDEERVAAEDDVVVVVVEEPAAAPARNPNPNAQPRGLAGRLMGCINWILGRR